MTLEEAREEIESLTKERNLANKINRQLLANQENLLRGFKIANNYLTEMEREHSKIMEALTEWPFFYEQEEEEAISTISEAVKNMEYCFTCIDSGVFRDLEILGLYTRPKKL